MKASSPAHANAPNAGAMRCAIYTRVSTDHGLDQEFNSLDNQREAAEAYVRSQAHEGWRCLPDLYDDGGFSGGSMERPGLQRLLADVRARRLDIIVVYKVDRLTRSLADFAKLVELFDVHGVSFVSVTQAFNTTTSMGRLTLNVLLSFAQFEREVTGERIRDKIAASKRKGLWMGGTVPLGYRVEARKLLVEEQEAATVRMIFERYLELGSVPALQRALRAEGIRTRLRNMADGTTIGGIPFTNGPLSYLLRNRLYLGELNHRGAAYSAEHAAIIPVELFDAVQARLAANQIGRRGSCHPSGALLSRKLHDDKGNRMTPTVGRKGQIRYRYYTSHALTQGRREEAGSVPRVSAPELEKAVVEQLRARQPDEEASDAHLVDTMLDRAVLGSNGLAIHLFDSADPVDVPWTAPQRHRRRAVITDDPDNDRPMRAEARARLITSIALARSWIAELIDGTMPSTEAIARREGVSERSVRMKLDHAFLPPATVAAVIEGTLGRVAIGVSGAHRDKSDL